MEAEEEFGEAGDEVVAEGIREMAFEAAGPGGGPAGFHGVEPAFGGIAHDEAVVGFVGEDAGDGVAEHVAAGFPVAFVGDAQEFRGGFGIEGVEVSAAVEERMGLYGFDAEADETFAGSEGGVAAAQAAVAEEVESPEGGGEKSERAFERLGGELPGGEDFAAEVAHAEFGVLGGEAAGGAAGPAVFVVEPAFEAFVAGFIRAGFDGGEPFGAHVFRGEAGAAVHEEAAETHIGQDADLAAEFGGVQLAVPGPEGFATVGGWG